MTVGAGLDLNTSESYLRDGRRTRGRRRHTTDFSRWLLSFSLTRARGGDIPSTLVDGS